METESKRVDDLFLRKIIWTLVGLVITQWVSVGIAFGMYANQITENTSFRLSVGGVEKIAAYVSKELENNYMTRPAVEQIIKDARAEMLTDQRRLIEPINKQLEDMNQDIKFLVRREITKGDKK